MQGVVLAGGLGRRLGTAKATVMFGERPLIRGPVDAMRAAGLAVAVVAKPATPLPDLGPDAIVVREPATPQHPLVGIAHALRVFGVPIVVCAGDMPFVPSGVLSMLAACDGEVTVTASELSVQPLLGRYTVSVLPAIEAAIDQGQSMRAFIASLGAVVQTIGPDRLRVFGDPDHFTRDVDTPEDLRSAMASARHETR